MENIDNMGRNSLEALSKNNLTEKGKKKLTRELISGAISLACLVVGLIFSYAFPDKTTVPALLYTVGFLIEGIPIFVAAVKGIVTKNMTNAMEILVAIAIISCYFTGDLVLAVLVPMILNIVHLLEERSIMGGRDVIEGLKRMQQSTAVLLDGDGEKIVDAKTLKIGDRIVVRPGTGIPIDGIIVEGTTNIDQKSLTGEPLPFNAGKGDMVYAGTVNIDGRIIVEVQKEHIDTSFSKILKLLENSENISAPESKIIDRFMKYYIPFVLALAAAVALINADMSQAIAILVVSCPCGQMLVSSAPMIAALSVATKRGILIKNSKFIEELTEIDAVVFDKTGTLTEGDLSLVETRTYGDTDREELLRLAATVAAASTHPVSRAVANAAKALELDKSYEVKEISGKGMSGTSADGAHIILFGNREWIFGETGVTLDDEFGTDIDVPSSYVAFDGKLCGVLCFNDTVRPEASEAIKELELLGVEETVMLTGDRESAAKLICEQTGVGSVYAKLLPQDKLEKLRALKEERGVLAVGDGINDALALREADVGIAMGAMGSDMAIESADIALMNNNLMNIPFVIKLARKTRAMVYQNLILSILISATMMVLSAFGVISALAGSILHNLGAFAVLINSSRLFRLNKDLEN
ncbi:MAG: cadmium-translocating P-type ATPase [Clostridia bacterium]|nr:cadmium-translocating P-type ATPase [Clostridia bacterium]